MEQGQEKFQNPILAGGYVEWGHFIWLILHFIFVSTNS